MLIDSFMYLHRNEFLVHFTISALDTRIQTLDLKTRALTIKLRKRLNTNTKNRVIKISFYRKYQGRPSIAVYCKPPTINLIFYTIKQKL